MQVLIGQENALLKSASPVPDHWHRSCVGTECSLHQLSPYVGKLKSAIAQNLIKTYSKVGDIVVDPFAGSGTAPFEAILQDRIAFAADISPYAEILCKAKLFPPRSLQEALKKAEDLLTESEKLPNPDLRRVPQWVRKFFHPDTLKEALKFASVCRRKGNEFFLASLLGILHHQRPGFLSYPSSHLVPYLRDKKFPRDKFPELYIHRELRPRLLAKIRRAYSRFSPLPYEKKAIFQRCRIKKFTPPAFDFLITSPPYMNLLDYGRDNRLRLWFINPRYFDYSSIDSTNCMKSFKEDIIALARMLEMSLKRKGYCVLIIGEQSRSNNGNHPANEVYNILREKAPSLHTVSAMVDEIPGVRRSRRGYIGTKREFFLLLQKR